MKKEIIFAILFFLVGVAFLVPSVPIVRASASEAQVLTYSWYVAPQKSVLAQSPSDLVVVGEIQNVGTNIMQNVTLAGTAYNFAGQVLASAEGQALLYEIMPQQKAPFFIDFNSTTGINQSLNWVTQVANVTVSVLSVTDTTINPYSGLTISSSTHLFNGSNGLIIAGDVDNEGNKTAGAVWVVTTFYNTKGIVVALNYTRYLSYSLQPGKMVPFYASPSDAVALSSKITNYTFLIDSLPLTTSDYTTNSTSRSTSSPSGTPSTSAGQGQLSLTTILALGAGVAIIVALAIVDLSLIARRKKAMPPPPPPPLF